MRKPSHAYTRKCVGAVHNINNYPTKLPPNYDIGNKLSDTTLLDPLSACFPKRTRTLLTEHGYNPENGTTDHFIELCERTEIAESIEFEKRAWHIIEVDEFGSSSNGRNFRSRKKDIKNPKRTTKRKSKKKSNFYFYCHGQNNSHDTVDCKFLNAELNGTSWENPKN